MVIGDFDLSGIGTVTHVEGNRVYGFGHPMLSLGACELPMMTGYIHTVYPRASVSMKMGSPLKVVGVIDTDVSTSVAGRIGPKPDMLPLSVRVKTSRYADAHTYHVQIVREPVLLPSLIMAVLTNAIDTEGNLPEELTAQLNATIRLKDHEPITLSDTFSGPRYTGPDGGRGAVQPAGLDRQHPGPELDGAGADRVDRLRRPDRARAARWRTIESVRLLSDTVEPGHDLKAFVTLKPHKGERETIEITLPIPADFPEGPLRGDRSATPPTASAGGSATTRPCSSRVTWRASSGRSGSRPSPKRTAVYLHVPRRSAGCRSRGRPCPTCRAACGPSSPRSARPRSLRSAPTWSGSRRPPGSSRGSQTLRFTVAKDAGLSLSLYRMSGPTGPPARRDGQPARFEDNEDRTCRCAGLPGGRVRPGSSSCRFVGLAAASSPRRALVAAGGPRWRPGAGRAGRVCEVPSREAWSISDNGRVRLGHAVAPLGSMPCERVWDLARTREGRLLAATGDAGKVFRREPGPMRRGPWSTTRADSQVLSLVDLRRTGRSSPGRVRTARSSISTDPKHPASRPDPKVQYIWDLAADAQGNVYAATGPTGQLWKRSQRGRWSLLYDSKATHLLCVAIGPDGSVYAGSDGEGLIYRVSPDGKATILFDAPQSEIRTLLVAADGTLYAGTAAESRRLGRAREARCS